MNASGVPTDAAAEPLTFLSLVLLLRRYRGLLAGMVTLGVLLAALTCVLSTKRYRATAEIEVEKEDGGAFGLESAIRTPDSAGASGDSLDYNMTLQTEAAILRSPALALAVIEVEHLERTPDYFGNTSQDSHLQLPSHLPWSRPLEPLQVPLADAPNRRFVAEKIFASLLKVTPTAGTRLIDVAYSDPDPVRAARVANAITRVLADMSFQQRFTATLKGSTWLAGQLDELEKRVKQAQARAAELERGTGMFGSDASQNVVLERLNSLNQTLTAAESNRILKESIDRVAAGGSPELISSLSGNSNNGSVASINTSLSLLQGLRAQEAQVRSDLAQNQVRYGPHYPKVAELQAQLAGTEESIRAETARLGQRAHTDWQIAVREEASARAAFEQQKRLATRQNDSVIAYQLARQEADSSRDLYEGLRSKLDQANLLGGLRASNVSVVSMAEVPAPDRPASPNVLLRLAAGLAAGLLLGSLCAMLAELTETSIRSVASAERMLGLQLLAVLPSIDARKANKLRLPQRTPGPGRWAGAPQDRQQPSRLPVLVQQASLYSEQLRALRTTLSLAGRGHLPKVLLVTSCLPREGKSTLAFNLAALLSQGSSRVLLVDADLRRPSLGLPLELPLEIRPNGGLADALLGGEPAIYRPLPESLPNLQLLPGGTVPPFPSELLGSPRMADLLEGWKAQFDMIVLDSPPVLPVTDAVLLSLLSDATLLLARHRQTSHQALCRGVQVLSQTGLPRAPLGVVLTDVAHHSGDFEEYFGHTGAHYAAQQS